MNPFVKRHKRIARANPCLLSMETTDPSYGWRYFDYLQILTVDAGYE